MANRMLLRDLRAFEAAHEEDEDLSCIVRQIEMTVDSLAGYGPHVIQFWRDVELYGLREAIIYLEDFLQDIPEPDDWIDLKALAAKVGVDCERSKT